MKISFLSSFDDSMQKATGASVRIYNLAKALAANGHKIKVVMPANQSSSKVVDGITICSLKGICPLSVLKVLKEFVNVLRPTALYVYDFLFILRVSQLMRDDDIIQIEQPAAGGLLVPFIKMVLKKHIVVDCHDVFQALRVKHTSILRRILETFMEKFVYKKADLLLTVSDDEKQFLLSSGFKNSKISVVPNGVDTKSFKKSPRQTAIKKEYGLGSFSIVVFVGNLSYIPNLEAIQLLSSRIAPKVLAKVSHTKFLVVGKLQDKIDLPGLVFTGFVDNVSNILSISDVAVAPLLQGSGTRLKILEYFSCNLPVVSTSVGAEGLAIQNGVNIFIEDNLEEFALRVVELLKNKDLAMTMGEAARALVMVAYDWERIAKNLELRLYRLLLNDAHGEARQRVRAENVALR